MYIFRSKNMDPPTYLSSTALNKKIAELEGRINAHEERLDGHSRSLLALSSRLDALEAHEPEEPEEPESTEPPGWPFNLVMPDDDATVVEGFEGFIDMREGELVNYVYRNCHFKGDDSHHAFSVLGNVKIDRLFFDTCTFEAVGPNGYGIWMSPALAANVFFDFAHVLPCPETRQSLVRIYDIDGIAFSDLTLDGRNGRNSAAMRLLRCRKAAIFDSEILGTSLWLGQSDGSGNWSGETWIENTNISQQLSSTRPIFIHPNDVDPPCPTHVHLKRVTSDSPYWGEQWVNPDGYPVDYEDCIHNGAPIP